MAKEQGKLGKDASVETSGSSENMDRESLAFEERWPGEEKKPACLWRIWSPRDWKSENSTDTRKHELSSDFWRINLNLTAAGCLFKQAV